MPAQILKTFAANSLLLEPSQWKAIAWSIIHGIDQFCVEVGYITRAPLFIIAILNCSEIRICIIYSLVMCFESATCIQIQCGLTL